MSQESRELADNATRHLRRAEEHLQGAKEYAESAKDPALVKQIEKVRTDTRTVREGVEKKLGHENG